MTQAKAIVLLSGGIDSTTCLAIAKEQGFELYALSFRYGQRHHVELEAAKRIAIAMHVRDHKEVQIDKATFAGSSLTTDSAVPKHRTPEQMSSGVPSTYVPARNTLFLSYALGWAEVIGANNVFIGVNALDHTGYPDCRPEFIKAFEVMANLATKYTTEGQEFRIHTPLLHLTKAEIIARGLELGVAFGDTHTCYDPQTAGLACGSCDACVLRREAFLANSMPDPVLYSMQEEI